MTELPRRSFTALPPPVGGADAAVAVGRRRRQRRRATGVALTAAAAVAVGVALAPGGGSSGAARVVTTTVTPTATPAPGRSHVPAHTTAHVGATPAPGTSAHAAALTGNPTQTRTATPSAPPTYRTGPLRRSYTAPDPTGARICGASLSGSGDRTHARLDWCVTAAVVATSAGHDLEVSVCRDQTTPGQLHLPHGVPVDLTVSSGDRVVWQWSAGQPAAAAETLATPGGACWVWSTAWSDVAASGRPLPSGRYALVGTSRAIELADLPDSEPVGFSV